MLWSAAEAAIRLHIETQWALSAYASTPLVWENETQHGHIEQFVYLTVDGIYADKMVFGSTGKRGSMEAGIVYFHAFTPQDIGKGTASALIDTMTGILELRVISTSIQMEGGNPPSPTDPGDVHIPGGQPAGNYYRCSGSVPFAVYGAR
ncbi:MAG: hypothetical protein AB7F35_06395 [Acetobacteraceae bacterium]